MSARRGATFRALLLGGALWLGAGATFAQDAGDDPPEPPPAVTEETPPQTENAAPPQENAPAPVVQNRPLTEADKALFEAVEFMDSAAARAALEQGAQADAQNENDATPLMKAAYYGSADIVALLLQAGAKPNRQNRDGQTPLLIAAMDGWGRFRRPETARRQAELERKQYRERTAAERAEIRSLNEANTEYRKIHQADLNANRAEIARLLLEAGANPRIQAADANTALHKAAAAQNPLFVRWLLVRRASCYTLNRDGETPLLRLMRDSYSSPYNATPFFDDTLRELLTPDGDKAGIAAAIDRPGGWRGYTPLMMAAEYQNRDAVRLLLERGADPNRFCGPRTEVSIGRINGRREYVTRTLPNEERVNALWLACSGINSRAESVEIARLLLASGAKANLAGSQGQPIVAVLAQGTRGMNQPAVGPIIEIFTLLLDAGADINARAGVSPYDAAALPPGATPLLLAYRSGSQEIVDFLRQRGADIRAADKFGGNALSYAIEVKPPAVIASLLKEGLSPDAHDDAGWTPLMRIAAFGGDPTEKIRLLLDAGANVNAVSRGQDRTTALHQVAANRDEEFGGPTAARLLVERGAKLYAEDVAKKTPLFAAIERQNGAMARALVELGADPRRPNSVGVSALDFARQTHDEIERAGGDAKDMDKIIQTLEDRR